VLIMLFRIVRGVYKGTEHLVEITGFSLIYHSRGGISKFGDCEFDILVSY